MRRRFWIVDSSYEDPFPDGMERINLIANEIQANQVDIAYYVFFRSESIAHIHKNNLFDNLIKSGLRTNLHWN